MLGWGDDTAPWPFLKDANMIPQSKVKRMIAYLEKEAVHGWKKQIEHSAGVAKSTVWSALSGDVKTVNSKVAGAIKEMYDDYTSNEHNG